MEYSKLKAAIEALLYVSDGPLPVVKIRESLGDEVDLQEIRDAVASLAGDFDAEGRGVRLAELAGGYQITTRPEYAAYVKKLQKIRPPKLSSQALETLAIIAYRQPIIRAEIEGIRGVSADGVLKTLLERRLIKIAGRQDVPGKPIMYATTTEFMQYFGLKDLSSLPSLRELEHELGMEENSISRSLEPELPGLDGPEMEAMAEEYRAKKRAMEAAEEAAGAADIIGQLPDEAELAGETSEDMPPDAGAAQAEEDALKTELDREEADGF
jgi:segregation and condensation protein B